MSPVEYHILACRVVAMDLERAKFLAESSHTAARPADSSCILTINGGSSSLKFAVFTSTAKPVRRLSGRIERIGMPGTRMVIAPAGSDQKTESPVEAPDQA